MQNIFAYTQSASYQPYASFYPGYVSLNEAFGEVKLTVRTPDSAGGNQVATCPMTDEQLSELAQSILRYLANK